MKSYHVLILFSLILFSQNHAFAQLQYSLDSTYRYDRDNLLESKEIVTQKDADDYLLESKSYEIVDGAINTLIETVRAREYFADKSLKTSLSNRCYPFHDTCITTSYLEYNEFGDWIGYTSSFPSVDHDMDNFEITRYMLTQDSSVLYPNGRLQSRYRFRVDALLGDRTLRERTDYFYNMDGQPDSLLFFIPDGNDWILESKRIYESYTDDNLKYTNYSFDGSSETREVNFLKLGDRRDVETDLIYSIIDGDTIISSKTIGTLDGNIYTNIYESFNDDGTYSYGSKDIEYLLDDGSSRDSTISSSRFDENEPFETSRFNKYYYTARPSSVENKVNSDNIILFPNPTDGKISLQTTDRELVEMVNFQIFDIYGKSVQKGVYNGNSIQLNSFPNGHYIVRFENGLVKSFLLNRL